MKVFISEKYYYYIPAHIHCMSTHEFKNSLDSCIGYYEIVYIIQVWDHDFLQLTNHAVTCWWLFDQDRTPM